MAYLIREAYERGKGTSISIGLEKSAEIFGTERAVKVGQQFCGFLANSETKALAAGTVRITNRDSNVFFETE